MKLFTPFFALKNVLAIKFDTSRILEDNYQDQTDEKEDTYKTSAARNQEEGHVFEFSITLLIYFIIFVGVVFAMYICVRKLFYDRNTK